MSFAELWIQMSRKERRAARAEMETAAMEQMSPAFKLRATDRQIKAACKAQVSRLIAHCKRSA